MNDQRVGNSFNFTFELHEEFFIIPLVLLLIRGYPWFVFLFELLLRPQSCV